jgi:hypothetical protein
LGTASVYSNGCPGYIFHNQCPLLTLELMGGLRNAETAARFHTCGANSCGYTFRTLCPPSNAGDCHFGNLFVLDELDRVAGRAHDEDKNVYGRLQLRAHPGYGWIGVHSRGALISRSLMWTGLGTHQGGPGDWMGAAVCVPVGKPLKG